MNIKLKFLIMMSISLFLLACGNESKQKSAHHKVYQVKKMSIQKKLHFTGNIQPLAESSLSSPVDAIIEKIHYQYGQWVKKGDILLTLNSSALQKQYNDALTEYLKAKDNYTIARTKFTGTQELWAVGLLSKNNYLSEKSSFDNARVVLMQTTRHLAEMLEKMDEESVPDLADLSELSYSEFDKVRKALTARHNIVHIKAPNDGILLYPPKSNDDKAARLAVGNVVKADQLIGLIGDLNGIRVEIDIPEIDIDKVYTGMEATVRGIAFGKEEFKGKLVSVNAQASTNSIGGLPSFTAIVEIKKLTPQQQAYIKVGMSASIELATESKEQLLIPINAIQQEKGQSVVRIKEKNGQWSTKIVTTGAAEADKVIITSGLKEGDWVLYG
ncbi:HlyD family efflux transporter periplasmic adaptor subunit [Legionella israelensis]|uniref:HlyD family efflux transporter periplasmic adaptor subunit n=1 Tax=Legionella israelensis TaxID=454 RepID=A0AAX1EDN3_9GAMM|nr:efflux RND transporter periplasmic adaptor subunit [Legionella israelensis]QBR83137.1 HlyD family efflux transporter periplasmic adaptor subunit [Legionella israelensis]